MAKFCKYCGKELKKGETCECVKNVTKENKTVKNDDTLKKATETIKEEVTNSSKKYAVELWEIVKNIFKSPTETIHKFIDESNYSLTMLILILTSAVIGLCTVSFMKGIYGGFSYPEYYSFFQISYLKLLLCVALGMFLGYFLLAIIFDLGFEKISQVKISFKRALSTIAISVLEPTFFCILSAILTVFSYKLAIIAVIYAILLYFINLYQSFLYSGNMETKHYNHLFAFLILLFLFLAIYLIPNLFI